MGLPAKANFPQHEKLAAVLEDRIMLVTFLRTCGYKLCAWDESENAFVLPTKNYETILDEFFEIDRAALVQEDRVLQGLMMNQLAR